MLLARKGLLDIGASQICDGVCGSRGPREHGVRGLRAMSSIRMRPIYRSLFRLNWPSRTRHALLTWLSFERVL